MHHVGVISDVFSLFCYVLIGEKFIISGLSSQQPPPHPVKAVESTTAPSSGTFEQYTLLDQLSDTGKAQTKPSDDAMIVGEPAKPVAGSSKHPDDMDVIDGELIY